MCRVEAREGSRVPHAQRNQPSAVVFIDILQQQAEDAFNGDCCRSSVQYWCSLVVRRAVFDGGFDGFWGGVLFQFGEVGFLVFEV
ncbi:hypothetical protein ACFX19_031414 [Malus domestica]